MPQVNAFLFVFVIALVLYFRSSSGLSAAYGIAVTGEMLITSILLFVVMKHIWRWTTLTTTAIIVPLFLIDAGFFVATSPNFRKAVGSGLGCMHDGPHHADMDGRPSATGVSNACGRGTAKGIIQRPPTTAGTAVFLTSDVEGAPTAPLHSLKHYKVLHEHNVILSVVTG